jgi:hypothetical protein
VPAELAIPVPFLHPLFERLRPRTQTENATAAYDEILEDALLEMMLRQSGPRLEDEWSRESESERPHVDPAFQDEFVEQWKTASGKRRIEMLGAAWFSYYRPQFYREGMNRILWGYAKQLEYPDALALKRFQETVAEQLRIAGGKPLTMMPSAHGYGHFPTQVFVIPTTADYAIAQRLAVTGICQISPVPESPGGIPTGFKLVTPNTELVGNLLEFVFANYGEK